MKLFFDIFLVFFIAQFSDSQVLMTVEEDSGKIPAYIRELLKDFNQKDPNIHDVLILNLETGSSDDFTNLIIKEIPEENPLMIPKIGTRLDDTRLRPASLVIIISDIFDLGELFFKGRQSFESNFCQNTAKFIFVSPKSMTFFDIYNVSLLFVYIGAYQVVIISENKDNLQIEALNPFKEISIYSLQNRPDVDYVYQEKLKDLNGYNYTALAFTQQPRFNKLENGEYRGIDVKFMETVAEKQNAKFIITRFVQGLTDSEFKDIYLISMFKNVVDLTINTAIMSVNEYTLKTFKIVNTFDVNGFCAFVPKPPRTSFLAKMLTPFDVYTWILFLITIGSCVVIWRMFNLLGDGKEDSAWYFMFGIIGYFLLQSIPFRNNRIIQRSLLQICIFMMFILGNAYQSLIISFISESRYGVTIKTFDELIVSNYSLKVDSIFYSLMKSTASMMELDGFARDLNYQQEAANNTAFILRCDMAEYIMYADEYDSHAIDYFYLLPDQAFSYYESFPTSRFSPHHQKLQYFSSLIFESGIRQHWKEFNQFKDIRGKIETKKINNEEYLINFDDLIGVFYLLGLGFISGILVLTMEIFWHDCLQHLKYPMIQEFMMKNQKVQMKVTRIEVKTIETSV